MTTRTTRIYKKSSYGEIHIGSIEDDLIYTMQGSSKIEAGHIASGNQIVRKTTRSEQDLGYFTPEGEIISHGLFEGGSLGWLDDDGVVVQGGMILGEEEVGRVEGPQALAGAAALLLHFLPLDAEENKRMSRKG